MTTLCRTVIVRGATLTVDIDSDAQHASISVVLSSMATKRPPFRISIEPYLNAGLSVDGALDHLVDIASDGVNLALEHPRERPGRAASAG